MYDWVGRVRKTENRSRGEGGFIGVAESNYTWNGCPFYGTEDATGIDE